MKEFTTKAQRGKIEIIYEDQHIIVIEKAQGVISYPAGEYQKGSAIQAIRRYWQKQNRNERFLYLIHRLDKDTSGLMVFAKTSRARESLQKQFESHHVVRSYLAVTSRVPKKASGELRTHLGRDARGRRAVSSKGKLAITRYEVLNANHATNRALIRCRLFTGRTHQIRIHLTYIGAPVLGDAVYGDQSFSRLALHAATLGFLHPLTQHPLVFTSSLPPELSVFVVSPRPR